MQIDEQQDFIFEPNMRSFTITQVINNQDTLPNFLKYVRLGEKYGFDHADFVIEKFEDIVKSDEDEEEKL